jgi:gliding motility-associated-like protein
MILEWGTPDFMDLLPKEILVITTSGELMSLPVNWDVNKFNILASGEYELIGSLDLSANLYNPYQVVGNLKLTVLGKPLPLDVSFTESVFEGDPSQFFYPVTSFEVLDPTDDSHEISLEGAGYDNGYFEIINNTLFWNSADPVPGKTVFVVKVQVKDRDGNVFEKLIEITRKRVSVSEIEIFNSFTPNNDGLNDSWGVNDLRFYSNVRIQIFEKSGVRVFYSENPSVRWDGTQGGKDLPSGTYYWVIEVGETNEIRRGILNVLLK